ADAERLAHRIDVDARAGADRIFPFERLRDSAAIFDHLEPALDVPLGVGDDLPVLARQQVSQVVHVLFDEFLELEHDPRPALRVGRGPGRLGGLGGIDGFLEVGGTAEADLRLHLALVVVEDVALAFARSEAGTADEMIDAAKHRYASSLSLKGLAAP